jgi:hypothetical protein
MPMCPPALPSKFGMTDECSAALPSTLSRHPLACGSNAYYQLLKKLPPGVHVLSLMRIKDGWSASGTRWPAPTLQLPDGS